MEPSEEKILTPIWNGLYLAELAARELVAETSITDRRAYAEACEAVDYIKHRGRDYSPDGLHQALGTPGVHTFIWPWDSHDYGARLRAIDTLLQRNPKIRARAIKVGMIVNVVLAESDQTPILVAGGIT